MPKVKAENSLIRATVYHLGRAGRFREVELAPRLFGIGYSVGPSGLEGVVMHSGVVSNGCCIIWGTPVTGWGVFEATGLVPDSSWQPFSMGAGLYPQYKCIVMSLGLPWGRGGRGEQALLLWLLISQAQALGRPKVRMLCPQASHVQSIYHCPCHELRSNCPFYNLG